MLRALLILALVLLVALAALPEIIPVLTWVLAFLSLLMLGDLARSELGKFRVRMAARGAGRIESPRPFRIARRDR